MGRSVRVAVQAHRLNYAVAKPASEGATPAGPAGLAVMRRASRGTHRNRTTFQLQRVAKLFQRQALSITKAHDKHHDVRWGERLTGLVMIAVLSTAGCRGGGRSTHDEAAGGSVPIAPTMTTIIDPYGAPATVDVPYVNRVLAALDTATGDFVRLYTRERRITPEIDQRIAAQYGSGEGHDLEVRALESTRDAKLPSELGNQVTIVTRLITATRSCIYAQVERDYQPVAGRGGKGIEWVGLRPASVPTEITLYNPTHWIYTANGVLPDRSQPPNPCTGS